MLDPFVNAALAACVEIERMIRTNDDETAYLPHTKGAGGDISIGFDLMAEAVFVRHLKSFGAIFSEESGHIEGEGSGLIVLDPIDGSDNLKSNFPYYGASVAYKEQDETLVAVVCNFANGDCFVKYDTHHYRTSLFNLTLRHPVTHHAHAKVGLFEKAPLHSTISGALMQGGLKFRAPGAIALSLAYAYNVNYVSFYGMMRPYDLDAGLYLCDNLHVMQNDAWLVVAKDKAIFDKVTAIFLRGDH